MLYSALAEIPQKPTGSDSRSMLHLFERRTSSMCGPMRRKFGTLFWIGMAPPAASSPDSQRSQHHNIACHPGLFLVQSSSPSPYFETPLHSTRYLSSSDSVRWWRPDDDCVGARRHGYPLPRKFGDFAHPPGIRTAPGRWPSFNSYAG